MDVSQAGQNASQDLPRVLLQYRTLVQHLAVGRLGSFNGWATAQLAAVMFTYCNYVSDCPCTKGRQQGRVRPQMQSSPPSGKLLPSHKPPENITHAPHLPHTFPHTCCSVRGQNSICMYSSCMPLAALPLRLAVAVSAPASVETRLLLRATAAGPEPVSVPALVPVLVVDVVSLAPRANRSLAELSSVLPSCESNNSAA